MNLIIMLFLWFFNFKLLKFIGFTFFRSLKVRTIFEKISIMIFCLLGIKYHCDFFRNKIPLWFFLGPWKFQRGQIHWFYHVHHLHHLAGFRAHLFWHGQFLWGNIFDPFFRPGGTYGASAVGIFPHLFLADVLTLIQFTMAVFWGIFDQKVFETYTSISIFDSYDMKTLRFEFGHDDIFTGFKMSTL